MSYAGDLTPQQAWDLLTSDENALLVDVRTDAEWAYVGIPDVRDRRARGARRVGVVPVRAPEPAVPQAARRDRPGARRRRPVVFLCRSGVRSVAAANAATAAGFGPAYNVLEGFEGDVGADGHRGHSGWRAAGLPWRQR